MFVTPTLPIRSIKERPAAKASLHLLQEESWLIDTEVRYQLLERRSAWYLTMVFVDVQNAMRFITRRIDVYYSRHKAETYAKILQRGIRKDARGTLKSDWNAFRICTN